MNASTAVATTQKRSVLFDVASKYGMEEVDFESTVRQQCSPAGRDARPLTKEEFLALILVSNEYNLNPITREIYAFPKRSGGIVPIVSVDGWVSLVNSHKAFDGVEFSVENDANGRLLSTTCRIFRKDRSKPIEVTEYLAECYRETDPWKMKHRMLRHKSFIQCARYAFGFSGIYDEDEGERIINAENVRDITPPPPAPEPPSQPEAKKLPEEQFDFEAAMQAMRADLKKASTSDEVKSVWQTHAALWWKRLNPEQQISAQKIASDRRSAVIAAVGPKADNVPPAFNLNAFSEDFDDRASAIRSFELLDALWGEVVEAAHEGGLISNQDKESVLAPIYDKHRARIDEIFPMDRG